LRIIVEIGENLKGLKNNRGNPHLLSGGSDLKAIVGVALRGGKRPKVLVEKF